MNVLSVRAQQRERRGGFSTLELAIVVAVVVLIAWIAASPLLRFRDHQVLVSSSEQLVGALREARSETLNSKNDRRYGVHIEESRFVVFEDAWVEGAATNKVTYFEPIVVATSTTLQGGGNDIMFDRLTGKTSQSGTIVLELKRNPPSQKTITVNQAGTISVNE